mmetsp:Transcript_44554/g.172766  ORF Transcript_44554/g.172766 Transcript_44554/m.172766 type:complete len:153 (-) Transcript_44554:1736-2194(-)
MFSVKGGVQAGRVGFSRGFHSSPTILNRLRNYREWHPNKQWEPPRNLTYEALPLDEALIKPGTHWSPPRGGYDHLPFRVFRTLHRQLPVYNDRRGNGHQRTILRRFRGDIKALIREMSKVCDNKKIVIHEGKLEVSGAYRQNLISWLKRLGF